MKTIFNQRGFAYLGVVMVVATITLVGFVAFRFLDAQDNTQVATQQNQPVQTQVASVETTQDVEKVTQELDAAVAELDSLDAELDSEFAF